MNLDQVARSALHAELLSRIAGPAQPVRRLFSCLKDVDSGALSVKLVTLAQHGDRDDRKDVYVDDGVSPAQKENARSVAMIVRHTALVKNGDRWLLKAPKLFHDFKGVPLCPKQRFGDQPYVQDSTQDTGWTGSLIHPQAILTCAHGYEMDRLAELRIVFGFMQTGPKQYVLEIPDRDVYTPSRVYDYQYKDYGPDWAVLLLSIDDKKKPIMHRPWLPIADPPEESVAHGEVYAIGYPFGLPIKVCTDKYLKSTCLEGVFAAPLDTDSGNSGSPVFHKDRLVGTVSRSQIGEPVDYEEILVTNPQPGVSSVCRAYQQYRSIGPTIGCPSVDGQMIETQQIGGQLCTSSLGFKNCIARLHKELPLQ